MLISTRPVSRARRTIPYSSGPRKKSGKIVRMSIFIAEPSRWSFVVGRLSNPFLTTPILPQTTIDRRLATSFLLHRRIHFQQAFRQLHPDSPALQIELFQERFGEGDLVRQLRR